MANERNCRNCVKLKRAKPSPSSLQPRRYALIFLTRFNKKTSLPCGRGRNNLAVRHPPIRAVFGRCLIFSISKRKDLSSSSLQVHHSRCTLVAPRRPQEGSASKPSDQK